MDRESANWCPLAQMLMHKGKEVLKQFLLMEILTTIFTNYSRFWMTNVHNPAKINYLAILWNDLNEILRKSPNPNEKVLNDMLESWTTICDTQTTLMEQIHCLEQWKNAIEKEQDTSISGDTNVILLSWLSKIEQEIQELTKLFTVISQWNNTFHYNLQNAQSGLLLEIEKNEGFLSSCNYKLGLLNNPSGSEFKQLVQDFKQELVIWKSKCCEVLQGFCFGCRNLICVGLREAKDVRQSYAMAKFLSRFQNEIDNCDVQSHVDIFCDKWDDDLQNVFNRYEMQIHEGISTKAISSLAQSLIKDLEQFSSFKEKKIKDFYSYFTPSNLPRILKSKYSKFKDMYRSSDPNQFDLTFVVAVWKNGNFVHSPLQDRDEDPHDWDTSISADILRLRRYRNNIIDLIAQIRISSDKLENLWKELAKLLRKIASRCGDKFSAYFSMEIKQLKDRRLEPQKEYELKKEFLSWCTDDILIQLSAGTPAGLLCIDMLQSIQTALENLPISNQAFTCRICNKDFSTDRDFAEHMGTHRALKCDSCNRSFATTFDIEEHFKTCTVCWCRCHDWICTRDAIGEHLRTHQAWTCLCCNRRFSTRKEISQHMRTHPAMRCNSCSEYFPTEQDLDNHRRRHHAMRCNSCSEHFPTEQDLDNHRRRHHAMRCNSCSEYFPTEQDLDNHRRRHHDQPKDSCTCS